MRIRQQTRMRQKRRWRPSLHDIVVKSCRKHMPTLLASITANNALYKRLVGAAD